MIYSRTTEYALRALSWLSLREKGARADTGEVSRKTGVPRAYLAKIFQSLVRSRILDSRRGPLGGFALRKSPTQISLLEIVTAVDDLQKSPLSKCAMGLNRCSGKKPCPLHRIWSETARKILDQLRQKTLLDVAAFLERFSSGKRKRQVLSRRMRAIFDPGLKPLSKRKNMENKKVIARWSA